MKRLVVVAALVSAAAFAQEIGTEIAPVTPEHTAPHSSSAVYAPVTPMLPVEDPQRSASKGAFGIRANFGGSVTTLGVSGASSVGVASFLSDNIKLLVDLNASLVASDSGALFGFGVGAGLDILFRKSTDALRPLVNVGVFFGTGATGAPVNLDPFSVLTFGVKGGFGAEYFLSPSFSLNATIGLAVPFAIVGGQFTVQIVTFTPGVGATFYL